MFWSSSSYEQVAGGPGPTVVILDIQALLMTEKLKEILVTELLGFLGDGEIRKVGREGEGREEGI